MVEIAERVDHRHARPFHQFVNGRLREYTGDNSVGPAVKISRDVFYRLALPDGSVAGDCIAAQLLDGEFEGHARAQGRLFEQEAEVAPRESLREAHGRALDLAGEVERAMERLRGEIQIGRQVP